MFGLDDFLSGASIVGNFLGGQSTNESNKDIAAQNNATSIDIAKHGMQYKVADLKAAGLNPALAYNSGPINMPNLSTPVMQNSAASASEAGLRTLQGLQAKEQISTLKSQADLNTAQAEKARAEANVTSTLGIKAMQQQIDTGAASASQFLSQSEVNRKSQDVMDFTMDKLAADTQLSNMEFHKVSQEVHNAVATGDLIRANTGNVRMDTVLKAANKALLDANLVKTNQEINFNLLDIPRRESESSMWKSNYGREIAPYLNSASGINWSDIPKGELLRGYHSR